MAEETASGNTDITTLAIQMRTKEAENNLSVFNELLEHASKLAGEVENAKYTITIDANSAMEQLRQFKAECESASVKARESLANVPKINTAGGNTRFGTDMSDMIQKEQAFASATRAEMQKILADAKNLQNQQSGISRNWGQSNEELRKLREESAALNAEIEKLSKNSEKAGNAGGLGKLAGTIGGLYLLRKGLSSAQESLSAFGKDEKAERQLEAALRASGANVDANIEKLRRYASDMERVSVYSDEMTMSIQRQALIMGIAPSRMDEVTKATMGLAAAYTNGNIHSAVMLIGRAYNGNTDMLSRHGIMIDKTLSKEEKFNALLKIGSNNFRLVEAEARSFDGTLAQMNNSIEKTTEKFGAALAPSAKMGMSAVKGLADGFNSLDPAMQAFIAKTTIIIGGTIAWRSAANGISVIRAIQNKLLENNISLEGSSATAAANRAKVSTSGTMQEIALEKALQKEKMATIQIEIARANVKNAQGAVSVAQAAERNYRGGNIDEMQRLGEATNIARENLKGYEKDLARAESAARKSSTSVSSMRIAMEQNAPVSKGNSSFSLKNQEEINAQFAKMRGKAISIGVDPVFDKLDVLQAKLKSLQDKRIKLNVSPVWDKLDVLEARLASLRSTKIDVGVNANAKEIAIVESKISALKNSKAYVGFSANETEITKLEGQISNLKHTSGYINAGTAGTNANTASLAANTAAQKVNYASIDSKTGALRRSTASVASNTAATDANATAQGIVTRAMYGTAAAAKTLAASLGWIGWSLIGIQVGITLYDKFTSANEKAANAAKEAAAKASEAVTEFDKLAESSKNKLGRLGELSIAGILSPKEQNEAKKLIEQLNKDFGNIGVSYDKQTNKIIMQANATDLLTRKTEELQKAKIQESIAEQTAAIEKIEATKSSGTGAYVRSFVSILPFFDTPEEANAEKNKETNKLYRERYQLEQELRTGIQKSTDKINEQNAALEAENKKVRQLQEAWYSAFSELNVKTDRLGNITSIDSLKNEDQKYADSTKRLNALWKERNDLLGRNHNEKVDSKGTTVLDMRLKLEAEIAKEAKQTFQYKEKQKDADEKLLKLKKEYIYSANGEVVRKKNDDETYQQILSDIEDAKRKRDSEALGTTERTKAEEKLMELLDKRLSREKDIADMQKRFNEDKRDYVSDLVDGGVIRKKTSEEIYQGLSKEIEEARKKWDTAPEGSKKRLEAENKLFSLQKERLQYVHERETALSQDLEKMKESVTRFRETAITGISARSAEAIRLQSRTVLAGSTNYAKASAENAKKISDKLESFGTVFSALKTLTEEIKTSVSNIGTTSF